MIKIGVEYFGFCLSDLLGGLMRGRKRNALSRFLASMLTLAEGRGCGLEPYPRMVSMPQ